MQEKAMQSLWDYACERYAQPGVAQKLLYLQDTHGLVVNMLLMMHWLGAMQKTLDEQGICDCLAAIAPLEDGILGPLRQSRRAIKQYLGDYEEYRQCKRLELALEKTVLQRLEDMAQAKAFNGDKEDTILNNIEHYIKVAHSRPSAIARQLLEF